MVVSKRPLSLLLPHTFTNTPDFHYLIVSFKVKLMLKYLLQHFLQTCLYMILHAQGRVSAHMSMCIITSVEVHVLSTTHLK